MTNNTTHEPRLRMMFALAAIFIAALFAATFLFTRLAPGWPPTSSHDGIPLNTPTTYPEAPPASPVPMTTHDGESAIYPGSHADYRDGAWWIEVTGVDCPTEDSCYPMTHDDGIMIHETNP